MNLLANPKFILSGQFLCLYTRTRCPLQYSYLHLPTPNTCLLLRQSIANLSFKSREEIFFYCKSFQPDLLFPPFISPCPLFPKSLWEHSCWKVGQGPSQALCEWKEIQSCKLGKPGVNIFLCLQRLDLMGWISKSRNWLVLEPSLSFL